MTPAPGSLTGGLNAPASRIFHPGPLFVDDILVAKIFRELEFCVAETYK